MGAGGFEVVARTSISASWRTKSSMRRAAALLEPESRSGCGKVGSRVSPIADWAFCEPIVGWQPIVCQPRFDSTRQIAEAGVDITLGIDLWLFLPEDRHRDARMLQLARQAGPIWLDSPPLALRDPGPPKKPSFQSVVGDVVSQRPGQPGRRRPR